MGLAAKKLPTADDIRKALKSKDGDLTDRERDVLTLRFGPKGESLEEIGVRLGVTRERVRQIECVGLRKLGFERSPGRKASNPEHPFAVWLAGKRRVDVARDLKLSLSTVNRLAAGDLLPSIEVAVRIEDYTRGKVGTRVWTEHRLTKDS